MPESAKWGSPALAAITLRQGGDGVAYLALLLEQALCEIIRADVPVLQLRSAGQGKSRFTERARFILRLCTAQLLSRDSWWLFNHVGIARAQNLLPRSLRQRYGVLLCGIEVWDPDLSVAHRRALRNATIRIAISKFTADRVRNRHPEVGEIETCPLALLSPPPVTKTPERVLLAQIRDESVLILGRMSSSERYKGHDELLECWSSVTKQVPHAQLIVAGMGDDLSRLRAKAASLGLANAVLFLGFVADDTLQALLRRVALFALPSRGEGFGLVYLEAMRAGLACIGGANDAAADVIVDGETGTLVDPEDRSALATTIVDLLQSPEKRAIYGMAGQRRFEAEFTFDGYCNRLRAILERAFL